MNTNVKSCGCTINNKPIKPIKSLINEIEIEQTINYVN